MSTTVTPDHRPRTPRTVRRKHREVRLGTPVRRFHNRDSQFPNSVRKSAPKTHATARRSRPDPGHAHNGTKQQQCQGQILADPCVRREVHRRLLRRSTNSTAHTPLGKATNWRIGRDTTHVCVQNQSVDARAWSAILAACAQPGP